jgi:anhydro-N-acetylmuramic acid kinase
MAEEKVYRAIGMMSGTSLDGVDIALIETDGRMMIKPVDFKSFPYTEEMRAVVRKGFGQASIDPEAEKIITDAHIAAVKAFGHEADVIGFHGQTIFHDPADGVSVQIGDGERLARETGMDVVCDFRSADIKAGGQGAPLLPLYHRALVLSQEMKLPVAILNIGGVSNVTWIGGPDHHEILAFDCGPGNALLDDFVKERTGADYDEGGAMATRGSVDDGLLTAWMLNPYFAKRPPKSLDRDAWVPEGIADLSDEDGAATLAAFTVRAIVEGVKHLPEPPKLWLVSGGGRHNMKIMSDLQEQLGVDVKPADDFGWNGDAVEAEGFAYLAVRSLRDLPLSVPGTTGVDKPAKGGRLIEAPS